MISIVYYVQEFLNRNVLPIPRSISFFNGSIAKYSGALDNQYGNLPRDCLLGVLSKLEPSDLVNVQLVSKKWYDF